MSNESIIEEITEWAEFILFELNDPFTLHATDSHFRYFLRYSTGYTVNVFKTTQDGLMIEVTTPKCVISGEISSKGLQFTSK